MLSFICFSLSIFFGSIDTSEAPSSPSAVIRVDGGTSLWKLHSGKWPVKLICKDTFLGWIICCWLPVKRPSHQSSAPCGWASFVLSDIRKWNKSDATCHLYLYSLHTLGHIKTYIKEMHKKLNRGKMAIKNVNKKVGFKFMTPILFRILFIILYLQMRGTPFLPSSPSLPLFPPLSSFIHSSVCILNLYTLLSWISCHACVNKGWASVCVRVLVCLCAVWRGKTRVSPLVPGF